MQSQSLRIALVVSLHGCIYAALTTGLFILAKCCNVFALFLASDFLHNNWTYSLVSFTFILLFASSCVFLTLQKSWGLLAEIVLFKGSTNSSVKKEPLIGGSGGSSEQKQQSSHSKQLFILFVNGMTMMAAFTLFNIGLKNCGPIRAILMEFADSFLLAIPSLLCGFASIPSTRRRGLILVTLAVLLLVFTQEPGAHDSASALAVREAAGGVETLEASITAAPHSTRILGVIDLSEGTVGMCALLLSAAIGTLRRSYEKLESREFGGRKRLHAVSMFVGSVALLPTLAVMKFMSSATTVATEVVEASISASAEATAAAAAAAGGIEEASFFASVATILFLVLFYVVLQFYVESFAQRAASDSQLLIKVNLLVSFLFAALLDMWRGEERLTIPTVGAASILFFGVHFLVQANRGAGGSGSPTGAGGLMPLYATVPTKAVGQGHGLTGFSVRELKMMFKHFMSDRTSMRIFMFLTINFLFMFVELIYGWYSNSLGLISDAGHMLFDCTALAIGLYASFVSKLKPNQLYTYGYGRYEIISGYTNAVFLLFIGYFIFVESVERLFSPPEITSDSLVLVSVLGLCVNMVGLFFFHDHGSHGHSHSGPGGGHGHSHGPSTQPAASTAHQDHGHSHGTGGACTGDHGNSTASKASAGEQAQHNSNMFAIYLHILADALGSVGVIISSLLVKYYDWTAADAICSIIISVLIVASVIPLIRSTLDTLNQRIPVFKEPAIRDTLRRLTEELDGVVAYREPHFWTFSDTETIGTIHVQVREDVDEQRMLQQISDLFRDSGVGISNLSIQLEKNAFIASIDNELKVRPFLTSGHL